MGYIVEIFCDQSGLFRDHHFTDERTVIRVNFDKVNACPQGHINPELLRPFGNTDYLQNLYP
jgi:hypothetical protein